MRSGEHDATGERGSELGGDGQAVLRVERVFEGSAEAQGFSFAWPNLEPGWLGGRSPATRVQHAWPTVTHSLPQCNPFPTFWPTPGTWCPFSVANPRGYGGFGAVAAAGSGPSRAARWVANSTPAHEACALLSRDRLLGRQAIAQRASCCLHRTFEHHRTGAYPHFPVPKIAALPRVHPPKLPMYSQSRAAA